MEKELCIIKMVAATKEIGKKGKGTGMVYFNTKIEISAKGLDMKIF